MITYKFFKYTFQHIKYCKILKKVYKNEKLLYNLSQLFNAEFKIDWVGRLYTVVNPIAQSDQNTRIFEYDESGFNPDVFVEKYIMDKMNAANQFIQTNNLFDLLTYKIEKIDDNYNYLFIIQPITWEDCKEYIKKFGILLGSTLLILLVLYFGCVK